MVKKVNVLCPYCFKEFRREEVQIQCKNTGTVLKMNERGVSVSEDVCPLEEDEVYSNYWGTRLRVRHIFDAKLTSKELGGLFRKPQAIQQKCCPQCGTLSDNFVCPHCHNRLPVEMIEKGSEIISVIGGPYSGKSNYIVSLIHELKKYGTSIGLSVTLQQVGRKDKDKTTNMYNEAKKTIFDHNQALDKTPADVKHPIPWIMKLESLKTGKAVYLVFYDTAGEAFKDADQIARDAEYLQHSKAVIVAFDTFAIPKIERILKKRNIEVNDKISKYDETWETIKGLTQGNDKIFSRPFAFVFTKFDVVIDNARDLDFSVASFVDENAKFKNSSFVKTGKVSFSELNNNSSAIKKALTERWNEGTEADIVEYTTKKWGDNSMFFGLSALGGMKDGSSIRTETVDGEEVVTPVKVLDPLVWILAKLGGFGIKTE